MTNILRAFNNAIRYPMPEIMGVYNISNRINNEGMALETYTKDLFCDSVDINGYDKKFIEHQNHFSYLGSQNQPPDFIIKNGDAFEVKKIESIKNAIALNSSYPKDKLFSNNPFLNNECRTCEGQPWIAKDHFI